jgi:hypothetical protein
LGILNLFENKVADYRKKYLIIKAMEFTSPDVLLHPNAKTFIYRDGQYYFGKGNSPHGKIAKDEGIEGYGDGRDVAGRISKDGMILSMWDMAGTTNINEPPFSDVIMSLYNKNLISDKTVVYVTPFSKGTRITDFLRDMYKQEQPQGFSIYSSSKYTKVGKL